MPEDVDTKIRGAAPELHLRQGPGDCDPHPTSLSGSFDFESGAVTGLKDFDDGDDIPDGTDPTFKAVKFAIALKGMIIPMSPTS